jgi:integrase
LLGLSYPRGEDEPEEIKGGLADRWRDKPLADIDSSAVHVVVHEAEQLGIPGLNRRNHGRSQARGRAMFATLSVLFKWLHEQRRRIASNPCVGVHRPGPPPARTRVLSEDEMRWFWRACDAVDQPHAPGAARPYAPVLRLLLLTGQRRNEVAGMSHGELSQDGTTWTIPPGRTKNWREHRVPLSSGARDIIEPFRSAGTSKAGYLFTTTDVTPISGFSKIKRRLDAEMLVIARKEAEAAGRDPPEKILKWRLHDLRRSLVTGMNELGIQPHIVEAVVGHVSGTRGGIAGVYNIAAYAEEKRAALDRWAAHVDGIVTGKRANVVTMRKRRK